MGENKQEWDRLLFILPFLAIVPYLYSTGESSTDYWWLIIAAPLVFFATIAIAGQVWNGDEFWVNRLKEGGILGLGALSVSLSASIWLIYDYLDAHGHIESGDPFSWLTFDVLTYDSEGWSIASEGFSGIGLGIYLDAVSIMLLFCLLYTSPSPRDKRQSRMPSSA